MNWALVVCEWQNGTDDPLQASVLECQESLIERDKIPQAPQVNCQLNIKYKTEHCRQRAKYNRDETVEACVKSVESIPREVSYGIGG